MEAIHLTYFETPKDDLKIHEIYRNEALLQEMESLSAGRKSLPDASRYTPRRWYSPSPAATGRILSPLSYSAQTARWPLWTIR